MTTNKEAACEFLTKERIAITGVSRKAQGHGSNMVYQRLRERGYVVFAVNPNAETVEGDPAYPDLGSIPGGVDAVVIGTRLKSPRRRCGSAPIWVSAICGCTGPSGRARLRCGQRIWPRAWRHRDRDGGCPFMFEPTADPGHKAMRFVFTLTGKVPKEV